MSVAQEITITVTTDPEVLEHCAGMMAATDPWITLRMDISHCRKAFEGPGKEFYVAMQGNTVAGFAILQTAGSFRGYIQTLCVDPAIRGRGVGHKLLDYCEEKVSEYSPNLFICVSEFNTGAMKLYLDFGFKKIGGIPDFVREGYTEYLLRKTRGPLLTDD